MGKRISKEFEKLIKEKKNEFISFKIKLTDLEATKLLAKDLQELKIRKKENNFKW